MSDERIRNDLFTSINLGIAIILLNLLMGGFFFWMYIDLEGRMVSISKRLDDIERQIERNGSARLIPIEKKIDRIERRIESDKLELDGRIAR